MGVSLLGLKEMARLRPAPKAVRAQIKDAAIGRGLKTVPKVAHCAVMRELRKGRGI